MGRGYLQEDSGTIPPSAALPREPLALPARVRRADVALGGVGLARQKLAGIFLAVKGKAKKSRREGAAAPVAARRVAGPKDRTRDHHNEVTAPPKKGT
jgi:hypothetical protein